MRIATDIDGLERVAPRDVSITTFPAEKFPSRWNRNLRLLKVAFTADYLIIHFSLVEVLFFTVSLFIVPFHRCRLVTLDFFVIAPPAWLRSFVRWSLSRIDEMLVYFRDGSPFEKLYGLPKGKFHYVPFKVNKFEKVRRTEVFDGGYIVVAGRSRRDFRTLFAAVQELPYPVKVLTAREHDINPHGSSLAGIACPSNVEIFYNDTDVDFFLKLMAGARLVVLPLLKGAGIQAGIAVYLVAMALHKCVIISEAPGVSDVLLDGQAHIVPPGDASILRDAIQRLWRDDRLRQQYADAGYRYAISLGGDDELRRSILRSINCLTDMHLEPRGSMLRVFIMDLLSVVAYYDAYLCRALKAEGVSARLGAITYHFDRDCYSRLGIRNQPGPLDFVGRFKLPNLIRRVLKVVEMCMNMTALVVSFTWNRPDVVHVQYLPLLERRIPLELWLLKYCRMLGSSLVATVHDIAPHDVGEAHVARFRRAFETMDALICHSASAKQQVLSQFSVAPERVWVIPHGPLFFDSGQSPRTAEPEAHKTESHECIVLCQGMIRPYKGIEFLLDAWAELRRSGTRAELIIAGNGEPQILENIRRKVRSLKIEDSVQLCFQFLPTEVMMSYYKAADIVVYPYKTITTSGALMTGIAQRKAIVATSLAPFRELLEHGKNALLCDYGDTQGLASALRRLIENPELRHRLADEAAALSGGEQTWREIAARTRDCYLSVTGRMERSSVQNPLVAQ